MSERRSKPTVYVRVIDEFEDDYRPASRSEVIEALGIDYEAMWAVLRAAGCAPLEGLLPRAMHAALGLGNGE